MVFDIISDLCDKLEPFVEDETGRIYLAWDLLYIFNQTQGELLTKLREITDNYLELQEVISEQEKELDALRNVITNMVNEYGDIIKLAESQVIDEAHFDVKERHEESI